MTFTQQARVLPWKRHGVWWVAVIALIAGSGGPVHPSLSGGTTFDELNDGSLFGEIRLSDTKPGLPYVFGNHMFCVEGPDAVVVERVELRDAQGGMHVTAFSTGPRFGSGGGGAWSDETIESQGWVTAGEQTVRKRCADGLGVLRVEVRKRADLDASATGLVVHWRSAGGTGVFRYPFAFVLCSQPQERLDECLSLV